MRTIAFLLLMAFSVPASAEEKVKVIQLFKTASAFLSQSEAARIEYVEGLADALNLVAITGKPDFAWYAECTVGKTSKDLTNILAEWMSDSPDVWARFAAAGRHLVRGRSSVGRARRSQGIVLQYCCLVSNGYSTKNSYVNDTFI